MNVKNCADETKGELLNRLERLLENVNECDVLINNMLSPLTLGCDVLSDDFVKKTNSLQDTIMCLRRSIRKYFRSIN